MLVKITLIILATLCCSESVLYSSFWAPLFNPRILNYRVDLSFNPEDGKLHRQGYEQNFGYRGKNLIENLGNGKGPRVFDDRVQGESYGSVKFYYTYPGANKEDNYQNGLY